MELAVGRIHKIDAFERRSRLPWTGNTLGGMSGSLGSPMRTVCELRHTHLAGRAGHPQEPVGTLGRTHARTVPEVVALRMHGGDDLLRHAG